MIKYALIWTDREEGDLEYQALSFGPFDTREAAEAAVPKVLANIYVGDILAIDCGDHIEIREGDKICASYARFDDLWRNDYYGVDTLVLQMMVGPENFDE